MSHSRAKARSWRGLNVLWCGEKKKTDKTDFLLGSPVEKVTLSGLLPAGQVAD